MKTILLLGILISTQALSHSGGTNSEGCHNETRTGGYHCHRSDSDLSKGARAPANNEHEEDEKSLTVNDNGKLEATTEIKTKN